LGTHAQIRFMNRPAITLTFIDIIINKSRGVHVTGNHVLTTAPVATVWNHVMCILLVYHLDCDMVTYPTT